MEPHARKIEIDFPSHPMDDPDVRAGQQRRIREFLTEHEAEHGPLDPKRGAEIAALLKESERG
jgi:hypothetical protein